MPLRPAMKAQLDLNPDTLGSAPLPFASSSRLLDSPRVHFPPTPTMTSIALTHSPHAYDRAPIQVTPNSCALPERGARTYDDGVESTSPMGTESYFQPRRPRRVHSMHAWTEDGTKYSISLISPDNSNTPIPSLKTLPLDSDASDVAYGSPSSPSTLQNIGYVGSPLNDSPICFDDGFSSYIETVPPLPDHPDAFSSTPSVTLGPQHRTRHACKKKQHPLQAGRACRTSYSLGEDDNLLLNDPTLEGCLGGF